MSEIAMAQCSVCGMPVRVVFEGSTIVRVLAVCGHPSAKENK